MFPYCSIAVLVGSGMEIRPENLTSLSDLELLDTYRVARRLYAERKFARDTERGRLDWQSARMFVTSTGRITEREKAVEASEELAKKGQHIRELTRDLDMLKADVDVLTILLRSRGMGTGQRDDRNAALSAAEGAAAAFPQ